MQRELHVADTEVENIFDVRTGGFGRLRHGYGWNGSGRELGGGRQGGTVVLIVRYMANKQRPSRRR